MDRLVMLYYGGRWLNGLGRPLGIETILDHDRHERARWLNGLGRPLGIETRTILKFPGPLSRRLNGLGRPLGIETHSICCTGTSQVRGLNGLGRPLGIETIKSPVSVVSGVYG